VADDSFIDGIDQEFIDKHVEPFYDKVFAGVSETPVYKNVNGAVDPKEIFRIAAAALFKKGFTMECTLRGGQVGALRIG
jgi:hypothetical protein